MKNIILCIVLIISLNCCAQTTTKTNPFVEEIIVDQTDDHQRVEGTKLFAVIPDDYKFIEKLGRYQKSEKQFIQFIEVSTSFAEGKANVSREALGVGVVLLEEIYFNSFEGIYAEGENPYTNENDVILVFGDNEFMAMIIGKTEIDKPKNREELIEIMKSIFYDTDFTLDELELADFTFDESISGFKYAMTLTNMFMYAEGGKEDAQNPFANSMLFSNLPKMAEQELISFAEDMVGRHKANGITLDNEELKEIKIGEYTAIVLDTKMNFQGRRGLVYQAVISDGNKSLMFIGSGYDEIEELREKYIIPITKWFGHAQRFHILS